MQNTKIEWADCTFNPWWGCSKVSAGCDNCYAEALSKRWGKSLWGVDGVRERKSEAYWRQPLAWQKKAANAQEAWIRGIEMCGGMEDECVARGFIKPQRPRVFCGSMCDVFEPDPGGKWGLDAWRADLFDLIRHTPNLDWLLLTKRPAKFEHAIENAMDIAGDSDRGDLANWLGDWAMNKPAPANVWIGATVENQEMADSRIPDLLKIPARVRFLSCEPLLGPVDLTMALETFRGTDPMLRRDPAPVSWVIAGGESGPKARPMHPDWARSLRDQCQAAGVPFLFKQWGEFTPDGPEEKSRVGKKAAGRTLDGRTWDEFPSP